MAGIKSAAKAAKSKINNVFQNGKLEKARVLVYKKNGSKFEVLKKVEVQFNPTEYTISRGTKLSQKKPLGRSNPWMSSQAVYGEASTLQLNLYFDSYTEFQANVGAVNAASNKFTQFAKTKYNKMVKPELLPSFDYNEDFAPTTSEAVNERCNDFLELIRYSYEDHEPPRIAFVWGEHLHFVGKIASYNVQYSVFSRDGAPVRAKIALVIVGEDVSFMEKEDQFPKESPDRTKQRTLHYGDQLWMMAQDEFGDPARWKTIASANDILNPRAISGVMSLKVPSIR